MNNKFYILVCFILVSIPFDGIAIDIGARLTLSNLLCMISLLWICNHLFLKKDDSHLLFFYGNYVFSSIIFFLVITIASNFIFSTEEIDPQAITYFLDRFNSSAFSTFRTDLKPFQTFILFTSQLSLILTPTLAIKKRSQVLQLSWIYIISSSFQAVLGIFQYLFYTATGINIFPIVRSGIFDENLVSQDAFASEGGYQTLRVNALAGEPKSLALVLCFGLAIICFFLIENCSSRTRYLVVLCFALQFIALVLTFSTLGYFIFAIGILIYFFFNVKKIKYIYLLISVSTLLFFIVGFPDVVVGTLKGRLFDRIMLEDFDLIYINFIKESPLYLLTGTGFGTFHLASFKNASEVITRWKFGIILPKLGILMTMATSGVVGTLILFSLPYRLTKQLNFMIKILQKPEKEFYISIRNLQVCLAIMGLVMRWTIFGCLWLGIGFAILRNASNIISKEESILSSYSSVNRVV